MNRPSRLATSLACRRILIGWAFAALAGIASAQSPPTGVVYVEGNVPTGAGNQIFAYKRDAAGALTPVTGSPFAAGGAGISPSFNLGPSCFLSVSHENRTSAFLSP